MTTWRKVGCCLATVAGLSFGVSADLAPTFDYIKDGLVAHWDAIDNAATGTHDPTAAKWVDKVGGIELVGAFTVGETTMAPSADITGTVAGLRNLAGYTVETLSCRTDGKGLANSGFIATPRISMVYTANGPDTFCVSLGSANDVNWIRYYFGSDKPKQHGLASRSVSYVVGEAKASGQPVFYYDGVETASSSLESWTGRWTQNDNVKVFQGTTYHSVRIYNRILSAEEVAYNADVDRARFFSTSITFDPMTFYNTNVVVRWPAPAALLSSLSNRLERSRFAEGPWTGISPWYVPGDATVFTDETASVGIKYYYRVAGFMGHAQHYGAPYYSPAVANRRLRCLERDLATPDKLYENAVIFRESFDTDKEYSERSFAFDGNLENWPNLQKRPHLGLDFGTPCYFGSVWCVGRLDWISNRVNGLCVWGSNDAEKPTADPVLLSEPFNCDSVTRIGVVRALPNAELTSYRFLYAWKDADWFGNVDEMCFFGWTDADIEAAGLPACPQDLAGLNGDTLGTVRLTWGTGANLTSYEVQCRPLGAAEWTAVQTGIDPSARSYDVTGLDANAWYEFRLIGHGADEDATSPTCRTYVYQLVPGSGTGLKTVLYGAQDALHIASEPTVEVSVRPDAEFDQQGGTLFAHANHAKAWVFLRGKLIVPLDGTYTLTLEAAGTDGYTCAIDGGVKVQYGNSAGVKNMIVPLTAGEHDLFIGYASVNERKFLHFTWALENVWGPRTVPTSQLIPASDDYVAPYLPGAFEGWTCSLPTVNTAIHPLVKFVEPGKYELRGSENDFALGNSTLMTRLVRGPFVLDLDVASAAGRSGIVVTDEAGSAANSLVLIFTGNQRGMKNGTRGDIWSPAWSSSSATCQRLERLADKTLNFYMKTRTETEWTLVQTLPQGRLTVAAQGGDYEINLTGKRLRVGFYNFYNRGTSAVIQNIRIENPQPGMMLFVR